MKEIRFPGGADAFYSGVLFAGYALFFATANQKNFKIYGCWPKESAKKHPGTVFTPPGMLLIFCIL